MEFEWYLLAFNLILIGCVAGGVARGIIVGMLVLITSLFFTEIVIQNIFLTLLVIILTAILFSLAGLLNAVFADSFVGRWDYIWFGVIKLHVLVSVISVVSLIENGLCPLFMLMFIVSFPLISCDNDSKCCAVC